MCYDEIYKGGTMNKKKFAFILFNPILLGIYFFALYHVYLLCMNGGLQRHLKYIIPLTIIILIWLIVCIVLCCFKHKYRDKVLGFIDKIDGYFKYLWVGELVVFIIGSGIYGYKIFQTAIPYNGYLSWVLNEEESTVEVKIENNQFFDTGIRGIIEDIRKEINIDNELYIVNEFQVDFDDTGLINNIQAFIYDRQHTYLLDYKNKEETMTVWIDNYVKRTYDPTTSLKEMINMVDVMNIDDRFNEYWTLSNNYTIEYSGYQKRILKDPIYELYDNQLIKREGNKLRDSESSYEVIVSNQDSRLFSLVSKVDTYIVGSETTEGYKPGELEVDGSDLYFHLTDKIIMELKVTDAALGSYFYTFSINEQIVNENPFNNNLGVASGMYFLNENEGMILITNASHETSTMYQTNDGGITFNLVELPISDASNDVRASGATEVEYGYINTPYHRNGSVYVDVTRDVSETKSFIRFEYRDGQWVYLNYVI